jgi:hypothetical protein
VAFFKINKPDKLTFMADQQHHDVFTPEARKFGAADFFQINTGRDYSTLFEKLLSKKPVHTKPVNEPPDKCPNCGSPWCDQEAKNKECFTCGFPEPWEKATDDDIYD